MSSKNIKELIENRENNFHVGEIDFIEISNYKEIIRDQDYFEFMVESENGGFFWQQSLHIYGYSQLQDFHDIENVNLLLKKEYGNIVGGLIAFAQGVFGNQFCFDVESRSIVFLDIETGARDVLTTSFLKWVDILHDRLEYFTGVNVLEQWLWDNRLEFNQRLCPKVPFVMGGEFKVDNLYASGYPDSIKAYANIAKQVYNLPDGTSVKLNIGKKLF